MGYAAKILADSIHGRSCVRLTTMEVTFPRIVLAEFNTHRMFSRNSASSRAIPVSKMLERVRNDPFIPVWWGKNQKGMQAAEELQGDVKAAAIERWLLARDEAVKAVEALQDYDVHKQIANRLLEPWLWHTVIVTATEYENFFALRCHKDAQPEIRVVAEMMRELHQKNEPDIVTLGNWHLPLVPDIDDLRTASYDPADIARISCARCARVSYLTHDGKRDPGEDLALAARLQKSGHMSPFEHAAQAQVSPTSTMTLDTGNFTGNWMQYRKTLQNEAIFKGSA